MQIPPRLHQDQPESVTYVLRLKCYPCAGQFKPKKRAKRAPPNSHPSKTSVEGGLGGGTREASRKPVPAPRGAVWKHSLRTTWTWMQVSVEWRREYRNTYPHGVAEIHRHFLPVGLCNAGLELRSPAGQKMATPRWAPREYLIQLRIRVFPSLKTVNNSCVLKSAR